MQHLIVMDSILLAQTVILKVISSMYYIAPHKANSQTVSQLYLNGGKHHG